MPLTEPRIFVGHLGIKLQNSEDIFANGFREIEVPEILMTSIQWLCKREDLATVRINIQAAYTGFSPFPVDEDYGSMGFLESTVIAKTNEKVWWSEIVGLVMPRIS